MPSIFLENELCQLLSVIAQKLTDHQQLQLPFSGIEYHTQVRNIIQFENILEMVFIFIRLAFTKCLVPLSIHNIIKFAFVVGNSEKFPNDAKYNVLTFSFFNV